MVVTKEGSFSAASRKLGVPLATVSRKVSDLEEYLGVKLLERSTRHLELTDSGRTYLASCESILEEVSEAEQLVMGEHKAPKGKMLITAPVVFGRYYVLPLVSEFLKAYPEIKIQLVLTDNVLNMMEEGVDLSVRIGHLPDSSLIASKVGETSFVTCASKEYLAAYGTPKTPKDLKEHECISIESVGPTHVWKYQDGQKKITVPINSKLVVSNVESGVDAAISGLGITRAYCYQVKSYVRQKNLKLILKSYDSEAVPINFLYLGSRQTPQKLRSFLEFAVPKLKKKLNG